MCICERHASEAGTSYTAVPIANSLIVGVKGEHQLQSGPGSRHVHEMLCCVRSDESGDELG